MKIGIIGGTGAMGYGLGIRMAHAGYDVILGSRTKEKAEEAVARAKEALDHGNISGADNATCAAEADLVVLAVPSAGHRATVEELKDIIKDKEVLDITVPLAFKPVRYAPPAEGSNAQETAAILGEGCKVAAGFHTISATLLGDYTAPIEENAVVVANDKELRAKIAELGNSIGITTYESGTLSLACAVEALTPMLISMNIKYGSKGIGIKLIGF